jgi:hypothetical protein
MVWSYYDFLRLFRPLSNAERLRLIAEGGPASEAPSAALWLQGRRRTHSKLIYTPNGMDHCGEWS